MLMQKKLIGLLLALALMLSAAVPALAEGADAMLPEGGVTDTPQEETVDLSELIAGDDVIVSILKQYQYVQKLQKDGIDLTKFGTDKILLQGEDFLPEYSTSGQTAEDGSAVLPELVENEKFDGGKAVSTGETATVYWSFEIKSAGIYHVTINYSTASMLQRSAERTFYLDGKIPHADFSGVTLDRVWATNYVDNDPKGNFYYGPGRFEMDDIGDELVASSEILDEIVSKTICGGDGLYAPLYLEPGVHTIGLKSSKELLEVDSIEIAAKGSQISYADYYKNKGGDGKKVTGTETLRIEAETPSKKSVYSIAPTSDRTDSAMSPSSAAGTTLNIIGNTGWKSTGEWVEYEINAPKEGFYRLAMKFRQTALEDMYVSRKIYINGEVPFYEANFVEFDYTGKWTASYLGATEENEDGYYFYLNKGVNTLRLEVTMGDMQGIYDRLNVSLLTLNNIYTNILSITGSTPDKYRDYDFDKTIPEVLAQMDQVGKDMKGIIKDMSAQCGNDKAQIISLMKQLIEQIELMVKKPEKIPVQFARFKSNMGSYGTSILAIAGQALKVDYITLMPEDAKMPKSGANVFANIWFNIKLFVNSFIIDYSTPFKDAIGNNAEPVEVWIHSGRDQAQILRQLLRDTYGDNVNVKLVVGTALLPSVLTGVGPHVSIGGANGDPINYAIRSAVEDLTQFADYEEVAARFEPSAIDPFVYRGKVYGLPENQSFSMMFYRTDIFKEYNLKPPKTWNEFIYIIPILQRSNMDVGVSPAMNNYLTLMYQNGEELYKDVGGIENAEVNFDSDGSISAFQTFCDFYTQYGLPVDFDFANRFRTGEMPLAIVDYTMYNQLTVFAPEIKGLWEMAPIPGTEITDQDGNVTVNNTTVSTSTSVIMLAGQSKEMKLRSWEFMKWWTSAATQASYCSEMESLLGAAGKQPTANKEALGTLGWTASEYASLSAQRTNTKGTPVVPGDYMVSRYWKFAYDTVYNESANASEELEDTIIEINAELKKKRLEFESINKNSK